MADPKLETSSGIYEKLEHGLTLSKLINHDSLRNLLERFSEYLHVGLVAVDAEGHELGKPRELVRPCRLEPAAEAAACPACAEDLPLFEGEDKFVTASCRTGPRFLRARIDNMFEPVGCLIVGPYTDAGEGAGPGSGPVPPATAAGAAAPSPLTIGIPAMGRGQAHEAALLLCAVLEEVVFANYQSYLFSKMHLQLSREGSAGTPGDQDEGQEAGILDSGELSSLF